MGISANLARVPDDTGRRPVYRRGADVDRRIVDATMAELSEGGYARLTLGAVAQRAGVARTTLYRRWSNKLELIRHVLDEVRASVDFEFSDDCRADLEAFVDHFVDLLMEGPRRGAAVALVVEAAYNPDLATIIEEHIDIRGTIRRILEQGVVDGQLAAELDVELVTDQLAAMILYRMLVTGLPIASDLPRRAVRMLLGVAS